MRFKISECSGKYSIYSIAKDESAEDEIRKRGHRYWKLSENCIVSYPDGRQVQLSKEAFEKASELNNFDVIEVFPDGMVNQYYNDSSSENVFFITEKCNSNCIMCPSPDSSRKRGGISSVGNLIDIAEYIPQDAKHFTITGGEPFMMGRDIFDFLRFLKEKFERTEFQILTNGRIFAVDDYCDRLKESVSMNTVIGIPVHASNALLHDKITRTSGSFNQTIDGIKKLIDRGLKIEIRIVVNALNADDLENLAELVCADLSDIDHVSIMGMEMTGNAWVNRQKVWIPYSAAFKYIRKAVKKFIANGIDVWIYNFPLCTADAELWPLCKKSISSYKVRYTDECEKCRMKDACGGIFAGTYDIEKDDIKAIV